MNIFYLDRNTDNCAEQHCDKHVVKMTLETAQLLSSCHRICDGREIYVSSNSGKRTVRNWVLDDERNNILYKVSHIKHPCSIWTRNNKKHYEWLYKLFVSLSNEFTYRFGKTHLSFIKLKESLICTPYNIPDTTFTDPPQAMPEQYKCDNTIQAYRNYYLGEKYTFAKWTKRQVPQWFNAGQFV